MKQLYLLSFFCFLLIGCNDSNSFEDGRPCGFAPAESNFPLVQSTFCEECYMNINFKENKYSFDGNQFGTFPAGDFSQMQNPFFSFYLFSPNSVEELNNSIGQITSLTSVQTLTKLDESPGLPSVAFGIYNYCDNFFEALTSDVSKSKHELKSIENVNSNFFYCIGEISATLIVNGEEQMVTAAYKILVRVGEVI
jgi:hypothetical protein